MGVRGHPRRPPPLLLIRAQGRWIGGIVHPANAAEKREGALWLGYLSVPDVDRAVTEVSARGGKALDGPIDVRNIGRAAVVADPQGAAVGFVRSRPGDPADTGVPDEGQFLWMEYRPRTPSPRRTSTRNSWATRSANAHSAAGRTTSSPRGSIPEAACWPTR
ncbi:hypothetical protein QEG98_13175 [Myxococcus sp. MxC21-1]|uniref:VOC family protein n=1 Tax=Myxococcus sp. MxC21-1 TaxID=3041439 RepID=UPI002931DBD8|nr:hypothetical protein [Myxococcus sp. MxC21-1]WNZ66191.1 hypothetical protein QEG98_13175 [Myxococcus sp. MxC21-1]